jgi:hypothetical protein
MALDIHLQLVDPGQQTGRGAFVFDLAALRLVNGPQKAFNRWVLLLLTPKGSNPVRPTEGTGFSALQLVANNAKDLEAAVIEAFDDATEQLKTYDNDSPGLLQSERIRSASLTRFNYVNGSLEVWALLTTMDGSRVQALLPFVNP